MVAVVTSPVVPDQPDAVSEEKWEPAVGLVERLVWTAVIGWLPLLLIHDLFGLIFGLAWCVAVNTACVAGIIRDTKDGAKWR